MVFRDFIGHPVIDHQSPCDQSFVRTSHANHSPFPRMVLSVFAETLKAEFWCGYVGVRMGMACCRSVGFRSASHDAKKCCEDDEGCDDAAAEGPVGGQTGSIVVTFGNISYLKVTAGHI